MTPTETLDTDSIRLAAKLQNTGWNEPSPELEWDDAETASITNEFIGRHHNED